MKIPPLREAIWFFDVDDTLIDTAGASRPASQGIASALAAALGRARAEAVRDRYAALFDLMMISHRVAPEGAWPGRERQKKEHAALLRRIKAAQPRVIEQWGKMRKWSREILITLAAEDARSSSGSGLDPHLAVAASNEYWAEVARLAGPLRESVSLLAELRRRKRPCFFVTSSDARLRVAGDGSFVYDPLYSEQLKRQRLAGLAGMGFSHERLTIGDPEDKPGEDFFRKALREAGLALGRTVAPAECVIVGDSFPHDLLTPLEKLGFGRGILLVRDQESALKPNKRLLITGRLDRISLEE